MNEFMQTLKGANRVMYKAAYDFHLKNFKGATADSAHLAGIAKLKSTAKIREEYVKPQTWVNLKTGKTHKAIR
jgi:hypothetical protein